MKKTFPVNINGKIYYIDEDAYILLQKYLSQLRVTFPGDEGAEILSDIESRISELFDERMGHGANVIVLQNVNGVIGIMGRPEELGEDTDHRTDPSPVPPPPPSNSQSGAALPPPVPVVKKLYRDVRHNVFGGVLAGLGQYMNWDVTVLRILAVILAVCTYFWPCVLIYLIAWLVIPPARTTREILEMQGRPVNLETVGHTVIDNSTPPPAPVPNSNNGFANFINTSFQILGKCMLGFVAFIGGIVAFVTVMVALALIAGMVGLFSAGAGGLLEAFDISMFNPYTQGWGMTLLMLAIALPMLALLWAGCVVLFKAPSMSRPMVIAGIVIEVVLVIAALVLLNSGGARVLSAVVPVSTMLPVTFG